MGDIASLDSGDQLVAEYNGSTLLRRYAHGAGVDAPITWYEGATLAPASRRFLHTDHQGPIVATSDNAGAATIYAYGPYGEPTSWTSPTPLSRFRYTGQIALPEIQLYHYKARAYDPALGRFLQTDPVGYDAGFNLYAYVGNDPLNLSDPSGLVTCSADNPGDRARCNIVEEDARRAAAALRNTQRRLRNLASGRNSRETRVTRRAFERVYGRGSATAGNVMRIAEAAAAAAEWLDSPETLAILAGPGPGESPGSVPEELNPTSINIYNRYFGHAGRERSSMARQGTLFHESGHAGGMARHRFFGYTAPNGAYSRSYLSAEGAEALRAYLDIYGTDATLSEADAFRCVAQPMASDCP